MIKNKALSRAFAKKIGGVFLSFPFGLIPALGAEQPPRSVAVSGMCTRMVVPDRGSIQLTSEYKDMNLKLATEKAQEAYEKARNQIKKLNLSDMDLHTSEYTVHEVNEWEKDRTIFKGYRVRIGLKVVTSQINRLGEVIQIGNKEGLKDIGQLQTFLSDEKQQKEQFDCLQAAAENARAKAARLAQSLGAKLGPVLQIGETQISQPWTPRAEFAVAAMADGGMRGKREPAPIEAGQQTISVTVQTTFQIN